MVISRPIAEVTNTELTNTEHDRSYHLLQVGSVTRETPDAISFVLDVPDELRPAFAYEAGQFCTFRVQVGDASYVRCYSMSSSPGFDTELRITVKRTPDGVVSNWMHDHLATGDTVEVSGPSGFFRLGAGSGDVVAFSAGSGITPVLSLIKAALGSTTRNVRLLYANRDRSSVIFASEIEALVAQFGARLSVTHHLDAESGLLSAEAVGELVSTQRAGGPTGAGDDAEFYICGPGAFMDVVERGLAAASIGDGRIHIERFTPPEPLEVSAPAQATRATRVTVELSGRIETTDHFPGTTILQTARQVGMAPPFSCESGSCATCMAMLVAGSATMRVNNVLTSDEVDAGWVLTCQAVPSGGEVHVVYDYEES